MGDLTLWKAKGPFKNVMNFATMGPIKVNYSFTEYMGASPLWAKL